MMVQELRKNKLVKLQSANRDVLHTVAELHLPVESSANTQGVCLLPAATVETLLVDKRRMELVQPFKLALLKLSSQVDKGECHGAWVCPSWESGLLHVTSSASGARHQGGVGQASSQLGSTCFCSVTSAHWVCV